MSDSASDISERGNEIFERVVRPQVDLDQDRRTFVAIDVETEDFAVDPDSRAAVDRLLDRHPAAEGRLWLRRVGSRSAYHFGGRLREDDRE